MADPARAFEQPAGKPSKISVFVCLLKLVKIINTAMRVIVSLCAIVEAYTNATLRIFKYPVNRDACCLDNGPKAQERLIAELDSSLFAWLDSVPAHLRWDAQREDPVFFEQSCVLYSYYYFTQASGYHE